MRNSKFVLAMAMLIGLTTFAQREGHREGRKGIHKDLSVEQLATLKTKKMTLALDLSEKQQQEIFDFNKDNIAFKREKMAERKAQREEGADRRPSPEEFYQYENAKLDHMIAQQQKLKKILNDEQFDMWRKIQMERHAREGHDMKGPRKP